MVDNDPPAAKKAAPKKLNNKVGPGSDFARSSLCGSGSVVLCGRAAGGSGAAKSVTPAKKAPVSGGSASSAAKKPIQSAPTPSAKKPAGAAPTPVKKPAAPAAGATQKATGTAQKSAGSAVGQAQKTAGSATGKAPTPVKKPAGAGTYEFPNLAAHVIVSQCYADDARPKREPN
jgi:hypothetical protein